MFLHTIRLTLEQFETLRHIYAGRNILKIFGCTALAVPCGTVLINLCQSTTLGVCCVSCALSLARARSLALLRAFSFSRNAFAARSHEAPRGNQLRAAECRETRVLGRFLFFVFFLCALVDPQLSAVIKYLANHRRKSECGGRGGGGGHPG